MNKEWSELNKDAKNLLNKKSSFKDGINKLIQLRTLLINEWTNAMKDLSIEEIKAAYRAQVAPLTDLADTLSTLEVGSIVAEN